MPPNRTLAMVDESVAPQDGFGLVWSSALGLYVPQDIVGSINLDELSDVNLTGAVDGQVLKRSGGNWSPAADLIGATNLDGLSDVAISSPVSGHVLKHNGTEFVNSPEAASSVVPSHIEGLKLSRTGSTQITVSTGSAYIESSASILNVTSAIVKTGSGFTASTLWHVYLFNNAGTPDIEFSTTAPAAPFRGTARSKTGDNTRRYLGTVMTNSGATGFNQFVHNVRTGEFRYTVNTGGSPFLLLSDGLATAETNVAGSSVLPAGIATHIIANMQTLNATDLSIGNADDGVATMSSTAQIFVLRGSNKQLVEIQIAADGSFSYLYTTAPSAGTGLTVRCVGYKFER